jgi:outer membrane lipoprotein carrier protein
VGKTYFLFSRLTDSLSLMPRTFLSTVLMFTTGAATLDVNAVRRDLENRYRSARTLQALFFERYSDGSGGVVAESGTVYFSRPGRMRWEYHSPEEKLFLVDGTNAWFYVPADHTASRAKINESSDWRTPLALLVGKANLSQLCRQLESVEPGSVRETADPLLSPEDVLLRCTLRGDKAGAAFPYVLLEIDAEARLARVVIREAGNAETEFRFGDWQENIAIPEAKFHFEPPRGVAIVDEESLIGEIR